MYIKELDNVSEIFKPNSKIPILFKIIICYIKKIFCILTVKDDNICVLPYKKVRAEKVIAKIIEKLTSEVVLSNNLNGNIKFNQAIKNKNIHINNGEKLKYYMIYKIIDYICKTRKEETIAQEIHILANELKNINEETILYLASKFKIVNIVTLKLHNFNRISDYLQKQGIAITVTNNKRKSLSRAEIIVNLDFNEDDLDSFNINPKSIIIQMDRSFHIKSKLFNGVNVLDYQMLYSGELENYINFDFKMVYEQSIRGRKYEDAVYKIEKDKVKIINLIRQKWSYKRTGICKKMKNVVLQLM